MTSKIGTLALTSMTSTTSLLWTLALSVGTLSQFGACAEMTGDDASPLPQAAVASALITSKTSFAKSHLEQNTHLGNLPNLQEENESFLMESIESLENEIEMEIMENKEGFERENLATAVEDDTMWTESCALLCFRSILVVLLFHLGLVCKRRMTQEEMEEAQEDGDLTVSVFPKLSARSSATEGHREQTDVVSASVSRQGGFGAFCTALHLAAAEANLEDLQKIIGEMKKLKVEKVEEKIEKIEKIETEKIGEEKHEVEALEVVNVDVNAVDAWDETALHMAARRGSIAACELLIDAKADVNAVNADDQTPLALVGTQVGQWKPVNKLENGEQENQKNQQAEETVSLCRLLMRHGANLGKAVCPEDVPPCCRTALLESLLSDGHD